MQHKHFVISRTDNIGDVVLTLPVTTMLKNTFPNAKITFLARDYVRAVIDHSDCIDDFMSWDALDKLPEEEAVNALRALQASTILHVFPRKKIAKLAYKAKIPQRIGTRNRFYHWLTCNQKVSFSRAKSSLHEAQLNFKLLEGLGVNTNIHLNEIIARNPLVINDSIEAVKTYLHPQKFNLILHTLSNGNGREWPMEKFIALINRLDVEKYHVLITGSVKESAVLKEKLIPHCADVNDLSGKLSLNDLLILIKHSNGLVANSTGPLHLAAAIGVKTLGLFPRAPLVSAERWGPLGKNAQYLLATRVCDDQCRQCCNCMNTISEESVKQVLEQWRLSALAENKNP